MSPLDIIARLTYINYAANRDTAPEHTPQSWKGIYGNDVDWMEERYQQEKSAKESAYVRAGIEKDRRRHETTEYDRTTHGTAMRPGS